MWKRSDSVVRSYHVVLAYRVDRIVLIICADVVGGTKDEQRMSIGNMSV